jgi:malonate-semialdehyde dehydrogenase (acetylating)/methylmalonate-semialdehyde dehydrogenase
MNKPTDMKTADIVPLWINGRRQMAQSPRSGDVTNPATGEIVRKVPFCNDADIDTAVQAAKAAFPKWRKTPSLRRARILMR